MFRYFHPDTASDAGYSTRTSHASDEADKAFRSSRLYLSKQPIVRVGKVK
ncbi:MAG: hypothetical protein IJR71_09595 [Prevotella sp.]|nr:hypothetical protein [Prevotella sp.]